MARFFLLALRRPGPVGAEPPAEVIVPCAGTDPELEQRLNAMLRQDYSGPLRFVFVTPSREDPAWAVLESLASRHPGRVVALASGRTPKGRSGKIEDLLFALESLEPGTERLLFADSDILAPAGWLRALLSPLDDPAVGAATAAMLYLPRRLSPGSLLRLAWTGFGLPFFAFAGGVTGQSWAVRRADFDALGVRELWSRSLYEDLALTPVLRRWGKAVRFVPAAMPVTPDAAGLADAAAVFDKWIKAYRFYDLRTWALGAAVTALKTAALAWALLPPARPGLACLVMGMDAAFTACSLGGLQALYPERFAACGLPGPAWAWAALFTPFLQAAFALNYARSLLSRDIRWGGRSYRVHGPQDIEVLG